MGQTRGLELRASWSGCAGEGRTFEWGGSLRGWAPWLAPCCHLYLRAPHRILPPPPPAVVTAYFGVLHSGRVRSCLQQSEPRQCLPRPLRHWRRHHLHSAPGSHLLSPYPLGIWASAAAGPGPSPAFWVWSCYFSSGTLSHSVRARGLDSPPFPRGHSVPATLPCGLAPRLLLSPCIHLPPLQVPSFTVASEPKGGPRGENFISEPRYSSVRA